MQELRRFEIRRKTYLSDQIKVILLLESSSVVVNCVDLSLNGIGLAVLENDLVNKIKPDLILQFVIRVHDYESFMFTGKVQYIKDFQIQNEMGIRIGLKYHNLQLSKEDILLRIGKQYGIGEFLQPTVVCNDPIFFLEPIFFRLTAIACNGGYLKTSIKNKSIICGIPLEISIFFPNAGEIQAKIIPLSIERNLYLSNYYEICFEISSNSSKLAEAISEFILIACPQVSLRELRERNFFVSKMEKAITVHYLRGENDIKELQDLRLLAYQNAGKFLDKKTSVEMIDVYDQFSRQILCRVGEKLVGAIRLVFVSSDISRSEQISLGFQVPDFIISAGFTELSRACVHPDYRSGDIMTRLVRHAILLSVQSNYRYVLANCNPELWPMYKKIGAKKIGDKISAFGRNDCQLIYFEPQRVAWGRSSTFLTWNQLVAPVTEYMLKYRSPIMRLWFKPKIIIHRLIRKLIIMSLRIVSYSKYKSHFKKKFSSHSQRKH